MSLKRTTFSESWYRVAELSPRLHPCLKSYRQHYRGKMYFVFEDPVNNHFFRVSDVAYKFLALLNGKRTIEYVWKLCNDKYGDEAPTQGEVIQLLGQLHNANLLLGDMPIDTSSMLKRYKKNKQREITGQLKSILFLKIPLFDPDRFLKLFHSFVGFIFTPIGATIWTLLALTGIIATLSNVSGLDRQSSGILSPSNLPWLYLSFVVVKILHEFAHGFACKNFGIKNGSGGPVHTMGVMLMLMTPIPYVDCSSSWALKSKWQRMMIAGAGMLVELMIAAFAVIIWSQSSEGSILHAVSYNVMFVTSVSTLLFNGNPLLRYDAYYILSDYLEIPNLASQSNQYFFYLFKRYIFGVENVSHNASGQREKLCLFSYAVAAYIYRIFIFVSISVFLMDQLFVLGLLFGLGGLFRLLLKPLWQFIQYLANSNELMRCRFRAVSISSVFICSLLFFLCSLPIPDRVRVEGVVEPENIEVIYSLSEGVLRKNKQQGLVEKNTVLVEMENVQLETEAKVLGERLKEMNYRYKLAQSRNIVESQVLYKQMQTTRENLLDVQLKIKRLKIINNQADSVWVDYDLKHRSGSYVEKGTEMGMVIDPENKIIRAVAPQEDAQLLDEASSKVEFRIKGRPEQLFQAEVLRKFPVGQQKLPSAALGYAVGGDIETTQQDQEGVETKESFFEVHLKADEDVQKHLFSGQILILRFDLPQKSIAQQAFRYVQQTFQKRFNIL